MTKVSIKAVLSGILLSGFIAASASAAVQSTLNLGNREVPISLAEGLQAEALHTNLRGPRMLAFASNGDLLIGSKAGLIYRLPAPYTKAETLVNFGGYPHSVAFRKTSQGEELWVAETSGLYRTIYQPGRSYTRRDFTLVASLPGGGGHNSRTVRIGPDQRVYVSLGITGNCSNEYLGDTYAFNSRRGGIFVLDESGSQPRLRPYASGLRNPIGFDWSPVSDLLYASNNGPDHWGFDEPKEVFVEVEEGDFFGMPWFQYIDGKLTRDRCITATAPQPASSVKEPFAYLPARSAPMAVAFPHEGDLGDRFKGQAFVAIRGSWGTPPAGTASGDLGGRRHPRIVSIPVDGPNAPEGLSPSEVKVSELVSGFQYANGSRWARPVGLAFGPDGNLYFTSDEGVQGLFRVKLSN